MCERGQEQRDAQGSQGRGLEKPAVQQSLGEQGGTLQKIPWELRTNATVSPLSEDFLSPFGYVLRYTQKPWLRGVHIPTSELKLTVQPHVFSLSTLERIEGGPALQIVSQF